MNHKELTKSQDFDREALVLSLKKKIRKGVGIPLADKADSLEAKERDGYLEITDFRKLSDKKALLWFTLFYKRDFSREDIRDIKVCVNELWARSKVFIPIKLGAPHKEELAALIKRHIKIDNNMKDFF